MYIKQKEQSNGLIIIYYLTITNQKSNSVYSTLLPARNVHLIEIFGLAFALATGPVPKGGEGAWFPQSTCLVSPFNILARLKTAPFLLNFEL